MKSQDISKAANPDLHASLTTLYRVAELAHRRTIETGTELVVVRDGRIVRIPAEALRNQTKTDEDSAQ